MSSSMNPTEKQVDAMRNQKGRQPYRGKRIAGPRSVIKQGDEGYPAALLDLQRPPERLYVIGQLIPTDQFISIVGARHATPYGKACANKFGVYAAERGLSIVSGGALGCDTYAHRAALEAQGRTVCVLGGGADQIYPQANAELFQRIVDTGGCIISEYSWKTPPVPYAFRLRNRIIAALSAATLIVEAGLPSGTFSTADEALAVGREVLVVPGAITSKHSAGSNRLLYQGATPIVDIETFDDILSRVYSILRQDVSHTGGCKDDMVKDLVLEALQAEPLRIDELAGCIAVPSKGAGSVHAWLFSRIVELEARGLIARFPDGRYGPAKI